MKKIALITYNDHLIERVELVKDVLSKDKDSQIKIFCGDFNHAKKEYHTSYENIDYVNVKSYKKNISTARLLSHRKFAKDMFKILKQYQPNLIYCQIPPNSLTKQMAKYKKKFGGKLVFDLIDMWPESLPIKGAKRIVLLPLLSYWRALRNKNLKHADLLITECNLYQKELQQQDIKLPQMQTVYLAKKSLEVNVETAAAQLDTNKLHLCYLGAINNIIDIDKITKLVAALQAKKATVVNIIGDGESRQLFIDTLSATGAEVVYHGAIYDEYQKLELLSKCHLGLNIMRDYLKVGLTIKSIDYFNAGLPIVNNIKEDTAMLIVKYNAGFNLTDSIDNLAEKIVNTDCKSFIDMRIRVKKMFEENFSSNIIKDKITEVVATK